MRIAVIGLGEIARKAYLPVLATRAELELLLNARTEASIHEIQAQYRIAWGSPDLDAVIDQRPQAAFVLSPNETHFEIARRLLDAGVDVYLEKPATLQADQTRQLAEQAERLGRVLMVGFNRRFAPLHIRARELLGDRPVSLAVFQKHRARAIHPDLRDQFYDDTIHQVDLLRYYCGEGRVVSTAAQVVDEHVHGAASLVQLEAGGIALVETSLQAGRWSETYAIHGDGQSLWIEAFDRLRQVTPQEERVWEETYASSWKTTLEGRGFTGEIDHFFECVQTRQKPSTDAWDSVKTQELVEAMVGKSKGEG